MLFVDRKLIGRGNSSDLWGSTAFIKNNAHRLNLMQGRWRWTFGTWKLRISEMVLSVALSLVIETI